MGSLPKEKAGVGSAMNDTTRQTGGALGVAVLGTIFAASYRYTIDVPGGLERLPLARRRARLDRRERSRATPTSS